MNLPKTGDIIVAGISLDSDNPVDLPMLVIDADAHGFWEEDVPTICGMWLGNLSGMRELLRQDEPKLLVSVYGPHPSRFCYTSASYADDELLQWDVVHTHTHAYLPATKSALEHIEIVGHVTPEVLADVETRGLEWMGLGPQRATDSEYGEYVENLSLICQEFHVGARLFWKRYGSRRQKRGKSLAR